MHSNIQELEAALAEAQEKWRVSNKAAFLAREIQIKLHKDCADLLEKAEAEVERLKLSMLAHFNEEHLAGDGPEIDRWKRKVERLQAELRGKPTF
jgi:hypothetical protein